MNPREFRHDEDPAATLLDDGPQAEYRVTLTLAVRDARRLWAAALDKGLRAPGAVIDDVLDVIGPQEDPAIAECIAMLAAPAQMPGCAVDDFWIDSLPGLPSKSDLLHAA